MREARRSHIEPRVYPWVSMISALLVGLPVTNIFAQDGENLGAQRSRFK